MAAKRKKIEYNWEDKLRVNIAGVAYYDYQKIPKATFESGLILDLIAQPDNPHDNRAIAIFCGKHQLGFVPRGCTGLIHTLYENKAKIRCTLVSYNPTNPTHMMFIVKIAVHRGPRRQQGKMSV